MQHDILSGDAPSSGDLITEHVWVFVVSPDINLVPFRGIDDAGVWFDVRLMH